MKFEIHVRTTFRASFINIKRVGLVFALFFLPTALQAGMLISGSLSPSVFSLRPKVSESTPNYYSISPGFNFGYAFGQIIESSLFINYSPASYSHFSLSKDVSLFSYGLQLATWIKEEVIFGVKGGLAQYKLMKSGEVENELTGAWEGPSAGAFMGTIIKISKSQFIQLSFDYTQVTLKSNQPEFEGEIRTLDQVSLNVTYTFNHFVKYLLKNSLFQNVFSH